MEPFSGILVTGTRFCRDDRARLRSLCRDAGIQYCGDLVNGRTTHLVVNDAPGADRARPSTKLAKAREWGIPAVSVAWLVASVRQGRPLPLQAYVVPLYSSEQTTPQEQRRPRRPSSSVSSSATAGAAVECAPRYTASGAHPSSPLDDVTANLQQMSISPAERPAAEAATPDSATGVLLTGGSGGGLPSPSLRGFLSFPELHHTSSEEDLVESAHEPEAPASGATAPSLLRIASSGASDVELSPEALSARMDSPLASFLDSPFQPGQRPSPLQPWSSGFGAESPCSGDEGGDDSGVMQALLGPAAATPPCSQPGPTAPAHAPHATEPLSGSETDDSCEDVPSPESPVPRRRPGRIPTGVTQLPGPLVVARPRAPPPVLPPAALADGDGIVALKVLTRAPRGCGVKARHSLASLKGVQFAQQVHLVAAGLTLSAKDEKWALRLRGGSPDDAATEEMLGEAQTFYRLPGDAWRVELCRFYSAQAAQAAAGLLVLPRGFDPGCELLKSTKRDSALLSDVLGTAAVRRVAARPGSATLHVRGVHAAPALFWRAEFDPDTATVLTQ